MSMHISSRLKSWGAMAPFIMQVVFVAADEYCFAIFESGKIFGNSLFNWFANATRILFSAINVASLTSALIAYNNLWKFNTFSST